MRKAWSKIFLLCMACMICMSGLCLAKDGNWIKYHNHDSSKYYVNPSSLKAREYGGRKYLEANVDISGTQMLLALDIENGKYIVLEGHNHVTGKTTKTDISQMSQQSPTFSGIPIYDKLIRWVEKNRPDVINEIRTHNLTAPPLPSAPRGKTDVSGPRSNTPIDPAPGVDRQPGTEGQPGGNVDVTNNIPPHTFTPVNYESQSLIAFCPLGMEDGGWSEIYRNPYVDGGEFVILTGRNGKPAYQRFGFDYNPDTEEFIFTGAESVIDNGGGDGMNYYFMRGHVVDDETVYVERITGKKPSAPVIRTDMQHPKETYKLQFIHVTEDILFHYFLWSSDKQDYVHTLNVAPYRFVSVEHGLYAGGGNYYSEGMIDDWHDTIPVSTMFAVRAFLAEGGDLEEVGAPPQGMTLPRYDNLKNKEMYTKRQ